MLLPIGDTPNPKRFIPWVTWGLIALNVAVYLVITLPLSWQAIDPQDPAFREYWLRLRQALPGGVTPYDLLEQLSAYDLFVFAHGYKPAGPELPDLFVSLFLHGGLLHLAGNMLFLRIFGDNVEHRLGRLLYLVVYLATGVAATLTFALFAGSSWTPLVGASGAISGVLGVYFLLFSRNRVKVFIFLFPIFMQVVLLPARLVLGFYLIIDNVVPFVLGTSSGVAYGAHIGGFIAGLAIAWTGERLSWTWPWQERGLARAAPPMEPELAGGDTALDPVRCVEQARELELAGRPAAAATLLRRCLARHGRSDDLARVYLALGLMRLAQGQPTAAYQHLLSVFDHAPDPETAAQARAALTRIEVYRGG